MITLLNQVRNRATFRISHMDAQGWSLPQVWTALPVPRIFERTTGAAMTGTVAQGGYHLTSITRWCLPDEDRAEFYIDTGTINGVTVTEAILSNRCVRIQIADDENFPTGYSTLASVTWKTVFVGTVISTKTTKMVGMRNMGRTTYHCAGILSRTRMWPLDRHSTTTASNAKGHPGYNAPLHGYFRKVIGNKGSGTATDPFGDLASPSPDISTYYTNHSLPLDGSVFNLKFTDEEVVRHALASSRATGEVKIETSLSLGLFAGSYSWPVSPGDSCFDLIRKVCNRNRGRGSVFVNYTDDDPNTVRVTLKAYPSLIKNDDGSDIVYNTGNTYGDMALTKVNKITMSTIGINAISVDLNGDHRITNAGFQYENRFSSLYDMITVQGEGIRVLCNLNFFGSTLGQRWSASDQASFKAIPLIQIQQRTSGRWRHVWRRYGIPSTLSFSVMAEPGATAYSINYQTQNDGTIITGAGAGFSSEISYRILPDLPIYEGWSYASLPPVRYDAGSDYLPPSTLQPQVMYQADHGFVSGGTTYPAWLPLSQAGFNIQTDDFGMLIVNSNEESTGYRYLSTVADAPYAYRDITKDYSVPDVTLASGLTLTKLNTMVGVELGTRVSKTRFADAYAIGQTNAIGNTITNSYNDTGRRLTVTVNGVHLWLGAPGAIWELDYARAAVSPQKWNPGLKFPTDKIAYVIRDDRDELSFITELMWQYYGRLHNPGTWTLKDCGFLNSFQSQAGNVSYPQLGELVTDVTYAGPQDAQLKVTLNTPVTCIHYNHDECETSWRTDYVSYDWNIQ